MIDKIKGLYERYKEPVNYIFFGGLATLLNFILAFLFIKAMGMSTAVGNILDNIICILFAFVTNRIWVFNSHSKGKEAVAEFIKFVTCRIGTMLMDEFIMVAGIDWIGPSIPKSYENLWFFGVKLLAQILVVVLNYIFSKLIIFTKKKA